MLKGRDPAEMMRVGWDKSKSSGIGRRVFNTLFGTFVPYTGSIHPEVVEVSSGFAKVRMSDRRGVRNHLNSIHAMAIANLAEAATGLALNYGLPTNKRAILVGFQIEYSKKARGTLTATANVEIVDDPQGNMVVRGLVQNESMEVVASVNATWRVGNK